MRDFQLSESRASPLTTSRLHMHVALWIKIRLPIDNAESPGTLITWVDCLPYAASLCRCQASGGSSSSGDDSLAERLHGAMLAAELPSSPLASFPAIFGRALALGVLSRRRVLQLAVERTVRQIAGKVRSELELGFSQGLWVKPRVTEVRVAIRSVRTVRA